MLEVIIAAPLHDPEFWVPKKFSWEWLGLGAAGITVLTIGMIIWLVLMKDEPEIDTKPLVDRAVERDRERARQARQRLDADSGRTDMTTRDL